MKKILDTLKLKWAEYLLEMIVIIFGIIGAFALNNWNDSINISSAEKQILKGLKTEMVKNKTNLERTILFHEEKEKDQIALMNYMELEIEKNNDKLDSLILLMFSVPPDAKTFDPLFGYIKSTIYSGKLGYIKNERLSILISSFEDETKDALEANDKISGIWHNHLLPLVTKHFHMVNWLVKIPRNQQPNNFSLLDEKQFEELIRLVFFWRQNLLKEQNELLTMIDEMIALIEDELQP